MKNNPEKARMFMLILPVSYCKPIIGIIVKRMHTELQMPQRISCSFPLATSYIQYPKSPVKRMLIKVRKALTFILLWLYIVGRLGGASAMTFNTSETCSIGFHICIPGTHAKVFLSTFFWLISCISSQSLSGPIG